MHVNQLNLDSWSSYSRAFEESLKAISAGHMIIYPTDTIYGIGANATDANAVRKVNEAKGRENKPISLVVSDFTMMSKYCKTADVPFNLLQELFPGPVTGIFFKNCDLPSEITAKDTIGVRIPHHHFVLCLVRKLGFPITSTSANLSGGKSPKVIEEVPDSLKTLSKVIIDGGRCCYGMESTIIDFTKKKPEIVRKGADFDRINSAISSSTH